MLGEMCYLHHVLETYFLLKSLTFVVHNIMYYLVFNFIGI